MGGRIGERHGGRSHWSEGLAVDGNGGRYAENVLSGGFEQCRLVHLDPLELGYWLGDFNFLQCFDRPADHDTSGIHSFSGRFAEGRGRGSGDDPTADLTRLSEGGDGSSGSGESDFGDSSCERQND